MILQSIRVGAKTVLRTGRILTLHPWEGTVGKPVSALGEPYLEQMNDGGELASIELIEELVRLLFFVRGGHHK
jgi:hypothetical protein